MDNLETVWEGWLIKSPPSTRIWRAVTPVSYCLPSTYSYRPIAKGLKPPPPFWSIWTSFRIQKIRGRAREKSSEEPWTLSEPSFWEIFCPSKPFGVRINSLHLSTNWKNWLEIILCCLDLISIIIKMFLLGTPQTE